MNLIAKLRREEKKDRASKLKWRKNNPEKDREINRRGVLRYIKKYPERKIYSVATRRASLILRTPKWLNESQKNEMRDLYKKAYELGLQVDHIIPLRGKNVSGLHVPWNLQLLTPEENNKKGNRY